MPGNKPGNIPVETVAATVCETGENPLWHVDEAKLYWTDIPAGRLYRFDPAAQRHEECYNGRPVGGFTLQADGALLLFRDCGNVVRLHRNRITDTVIESIPGLENTRFNDVIADPRGRVFAGVMSWGRGNNGRLYRIDTDGSFTLAAAGYGTPNGMGFTADMRSMFFTDSKTARIYRFEYDPDSGNLGRRSLFTRTARQDIADLGRSDGMTIDRDGCVWSARWDGGCILRYHPAGDAIQRIPMPTLKVSSLTFGGFDYSDLYVTSAGGNLTDAENQNAGALFRLRPGVKGIAEYRSRVCIDGPRRL